MIQKPTTLKEVLVVAMRGLGVEAATAHAIAAHALGKDRAWVLAHPETPLTEPQAQQICNNLTWVRLGRPLAYILGRKEFYGLDFTVTNDVLVPRPETELLVDLALEWLEEQDIAAPTIADVGTGSGAIGVTLAVKWPGCSVLATDASPEVLVVAVQNATHHAVTERLTCVQADLLGGQMGPFTLIAANLPYVASGVLADLPVRRWEPKAALDGGEDGLTYIRRLVAQAPALLDDPGLLLLEIGYDQGEAVLALCGEAFPGAEASIVQDYAGHDRIVVVEVGSHGSS